MTEIKITKRFYQDHVERDLDAPPIIRQTQSHIWIDANSQHVGELLADADFYADPNTFGGSQFASDSHGLIKSAKATKRAIELHLAIAELKERQNV